MPAPIVLLGASGSIGQNTLEIIASHPSWFQLYGVSVHTNLDLLESLLNRFTPKWVCVTDPTCYNQAKEQVGKRAMVVEGTEGLVAMISDPTTELVVNSLVGYAGFIPTMEAISHNKRIALANKETMVVGGSLIRQKLEQSEATLIPIDSELSALMFLLENKPMASIRQVTLTASGGALRDVNLNRFDSLSVEDVLNHPTWQMGSKITIDSATLINKGFEMIETHHFFNLPFEQIEVIIHRESLVHSFVEMVDGEWYAQIGPTDMRIPIQNALTYPRLLECFVRRMRLEEVGSLTFEEVDRTRYPLLSLVYEVGKKGHSLPVVLNRSNEEAVYAFLNKDIPYTDIPRIIHQQIDNHELVENPNFDEILQIDEETRRRCQETINKK